MALSQHLQLFNPSYTDNDGPLFPSFPKLPTEVRRHIWQCALEQRHRLIEVTLVPPPRSAPQDVPLYSTKNALNKIVSGRAYRAIVQGIDLHSKLLRTTSETRDIALRFYRVHIPCYLPPIKSTTTTTEATETKSTAKARLLYMNPENDIINLVLHDQPDFTALDFIHDLRAYDPQNMGLRNLAIGVNSLQRLCSLQPDTTSISSSLSQSSFGETLHNLKELIWIASSSAGRRIIAPLQGFQPLFPAPIVAVTDTTADNAIPATTTATAATAATAAAAIAAGRGSAARVGRGRMTGPGVRFNRAMPVQPITSSFELISRDPRPLTHDELRYVLTARSDPRVLSLHWRDFLQDWGIEQTIPATEKVLFAFRPPPQDDQVYGVQSANKFLVEEDQSWLASQQKWPTIVKMWGGKVPIESEEELARATRPVVGFWLFPVEALGGLDEDLSGMKKVYDFREYWPELAVAHIY